MCSMNKLISAFCILFSLLIASFPVASAASDLSLEDEARQELRKLFAALSSGNPQQIEPLLAPEFQLVRADGSAYNKTEYLQRSIPKIVTTPEFADIVITRDKDLVVIRLKLIVREYINNQEVQSGSPQLFVFHMKKDGWKVVASANFAKPL